MAAHTHDDVDWEARLIAMRRGDALLANALARTARRLAAGLPGAPVVLDVGCGTGGMSAALARELAASGGGRLVLLDATASLLAEAEKAAILAGEPSVRVEAVAADIAGADLSAVAPPADLIWASGVVHHLPDQQAGVNRLAGALRHGGLLALGEGGLDTRCLPWDLGVGEPGLEGRLIALHSEWFAALRAGMAGSVDMPYGWSTALERAGLTEVSSFAMVFDHPAPAPRLVREYVVDRVEWLAESASESLDDGDRETVRQLLDPDGPHYLGTREDLYLLGTQAVHHGRAR
jgi:SAM-dependent methyltransferase